MAKKRKNKSQNVESTSEETAPLKENVKKEKEQKKEKKELKSKDEDKSKSEAPQGCSIPFGKILLFTSILTLILAIGIPYFIEKQPPSTVTPKFKVIPPDPYPSAKDSVVKEEDPPTKEEEDGDDGVLLMENLKDLKLVAAKPKPRNFAPTKKPPPPPVEEDDDDDDDDDDDEEEVDVNELLEKNIRIQKQSSYKAQTIRQKIPNEEAAADEGFVEVSEGVMKKVMVEGVGNPPSKGDFVSLHCVGYMNDKQPPTQFWNTKELGQRIFTFAVGKKQVIKGWDESVATMKLSEISHVKISAQKAYGKYGFEAWGIPPDVDLLMEFEVIDIKRRRSTD